MEEEQPFEDWVKGELNRMYTDEVRKAEDEWYEKHVVGNGTGNLEGFLNNFQEDVDLPWSVNPFTRCRAVLEEKQGHSGYFGRCELKRKHALAHALERGFDVVRFQTYFVSAVTRY